MGWSIGFDERWQRDVGYGVPAWCDHPDCTRVIDRGLSYVCGGEPYGGDAGCGLYFCENHRGYGCLCTCCAVGEPPHPPKPEHPTWVQHKMTHPSWEDWRKEQQHKS